MEAYLITLGERAVAHVHSTPTLFLILEGCALLIALFLCDVLNVLLVMYAVPKKAKGFERRIEGAPRLLVAGDSTAVGTGAKDMQKTLAGFLAKDFPMMSVENVAVNGARTRSVITQLASVAASAPYEGILISTGGNDVWAFTTLRTLRKDIRSVLVKACEMSDHKVILIFFGNEGSAPFFPVLFRTILMWRTRHVLEVLRTVANEERVPLIELFTKEEENPFVKNPHTFFAVDGLHPSEAGYWEWYKRFWRLMREHEHHWNTHGASEPSLRQ